MVGKYLAYPEYTNSGFDWLGNIPVDWSLSRHKFISRFQKGKNPSVLLDDANEKSIKYLSMDYLRGNANPLFAEPEKNSYISSKNQILIIWDGSNAGEFVKGEEGIVSSTMAGSELIADIDQNFYWYLCVCLEPEMRRHANGMGIPHVNGNELKNSVFPLPSNFEQEKIANFLDHETTKIDNLIEKQQLLIKLLKEKRQAVISHAVTKGLTPYAPTIPSGTSWFGDIPKDWVFCSLRHHATFIDGDRGGEYPNVNDLVDKGILFLSSSNIVRGKLELEEAKYISRKKFDALSRGKAIDGDLVVKVRSGSKDQIGQMAIFDVDEHGFETAFINAQMMIIRTGNELLPQYLSHVSKSYCWREQLSVSSYGTLQQQSSNKNFSNIRIVVPPISEQLEICNYLKLKLDKFDLLDVEAERAIKLLQERRAALISAAVTGKIDVRNWQALQITNSAKIEGANE